jgi:hypothetical protein
VKPPLNAIKVFFYQQVTGQNQTQLAEDPELMKRLGSSPSQGTISRWLSAVRRWMDAGNALPVLPAPLDAKPTSVDPKHLDLGPHGEHRPKHQRKPRSSDSGE